MKNPIYDWNEETHTATCIIWDADNNPHEGKAICHKDDLDMISQKTGLTIAEYRARIQAYKAYKYKLKNELGALNQLYYSMKHSSKFNPKSYENKMLYRQIRQKTEDIEYTQEIINDLSKDLKMYINIKDKLYKNLRQQRNEKALN